MMAAETLLGCRARDRITGFAGTVTGYCAYLTGCNQALLTPPVAADGASREAHWFDVQRIELQPGERIVLDNGATPGPDKPAPIR